MFVKLLLISFLVSIFFAFAYRRHQVKRGDWVKSKERGNFGLVLDVDPTRKGIFVDFMNPQTHACYSAWFNITEFQSQKGIELK